jgi:hypothetical protein
MDVRLGKAKFIGLSSRSHPAEYLIAGMSDAALGAFDRLIKLSHLIGAILQMR